MKRIITIYLAIILFSLVSNAQHSYFVVSYNMASPLGKTSEFIDNFSIRGINAEQRFFLTDNMLSVGYSFSWQVFNKKLIDYTEVFPNGAAFGNQYKYLNVIPMQATVHYHLMPESYVRPYFGGGVGFFRQIKVTDMGLYSNSVRAWNFGFTPEAGAIFDIWESINLMASIKYNYAFKSSEVDSYSSLVFNLGVVWVY